MPLTSLPIPFQRLKWWYIHQRANRKRTVHLNSVLGCNTATIFATSPPLPTTTPPPSPPWPAQKLQVSKGRGASQPLAHPVLSVRVVQGSHRLAPVPELPMQRTGFGSLSRQGAPLPVLFAFSPHTYSSSSSVFFYTGFLGCFL